jgi:cytoskeletal protein CcmA (bactofilin family)
MGLFGRDERTQPSTAPEPARPARHESPPPSPGRNDQTVISQAVRCEGTLSGSGEIIVNGTVRGSIEGSASITIEAPGKVTATIHGRTITVAGTVKGNMSADERIELGATARVEGDITAPRILIRDGATFKGQVNMRSPAPRPEPQPAAAREDTTHRKPV